MRLINNKKLQEEFNSKTEDELFYFYVDLYKNPDKRAPFEDSKEDKPEPDPKVAEDVVNHGFSFGIRASFSHSSGDLLLGRNYIKLYTLSCFTNIYHLTNLKQKINKHKTQYSLFWLSNYYF